MAHACFCGSCHSLKRKQFKWLRGARANNGDMFAIPSNADVNKAATKLPQSCHSHEQSPLHRVILRMAFKRSSAG